MNKYIAFKATLALFLINSLNWSSSAQENFAGVVERIRPAVVALIAYNDKGEVIECGSGFFISSDGRLLSSRHLLRYASSAEVHTREGEVYPIRTVIAEDLNLDLIEVLVELKGGEVPYLKMTDVIAARDEQVVAVGHQHIVQGFVSYVRTHSQPGRNFLFSAATEARATGGPVVNSKGEVIAIATEQAVGGQTVTMAIASSSALALVPSRTDTLADWYARITAEPQNSAELLFFAGLNLAQNGDHKKAIPLLIEAAGRNASDAEARFYSGYARGRLKRYEEALVDYQEALRIAPDYLDALNNLGSVLDKLGRFEEAVDAYSRTIKLKADYGLAHNNLGASYYHLGRYEEAIVAYKRALELPPQASTTHYNLGVAYSKLGRYREAVESLLTAIRLRPKYFEAYSHLGSVYCQMGRANQAVESFSKAIDLNPNFAEAHNGLGTTFHKMGRIQEAAESFRRAVQIEPNFAEALNNLGVADSHLRRDQEAIESLQQAIRVKPDFAAVCNNLGLVYSKARRHTEGIRYYKEAVDLSPDFAEAHYNLGASYLALGDNESAFETYGTLKNLNQKLASQLFDLLKKQYAVSVAAPPAGSVHGFASPETPASQPTIQALISRIRSVAEKRALPRGAADGLIAELQIANDQPDTGNAIIKINLLGHFVDRVSDLVKAEQISEEEGQPLIDAANGIINRLSD
jgi:tetratricopeptide (TPR) repeat protein